MKNNILEALDDFQKKYVDEHLGGDEYDPSKSHVKLFDRFEKSHPDRIEFDLAEVNNNTPSDNLIKHLFKNGYTVHDYNMGLAAKTILDKNGHEKQQLISIGKVLQRTGGDKIQSSKKKSNGSLMNLVDEYTSSRDNQPLKLVISRDKHDIAGMSTDRYWESCMTLPCENQQGGEHHRYIKDNFKNNSLIAYVVKKGDTNIEKPISRMLINKYVNDKGQAIYRTNEDKGYGAFRPHLANFVNRIMKTEYPSNSNEFYNIASNLYADNKYSIIEKNGLIEKDNNELYHYNEDNKLHDYIDEHGNHRPALETKFESGYYKDGRLHRDGDNPAIEKYNGVQYFKNGLLHRDGDMPASIINNKSTSYYKYGLLHRDGDMPAMISYHQDGKISRERYSKYDETHRDGDKPADIHYNGDGDKVYEKYSINGKIHREGDKPAEINYYGNGKISEQTFYKNNNSHRDGDNPANVHYNEDGTVFLEKYYKEGLLHRDDNKPAYVRYGDDGKVKEYTLYKNNLKHTDGTVPSYVWNNVDENGDSHHIEEYHNEGKLHSFGGKYYKHSYSKYRDRVESEYHWPKYNDDFKISYAKHIEYDNGNYDRFENNGDETHQKHTRFIDGVYDYREKFPSKVEGDLKSTYINKNGDNEFTENYYNNGKNHHLSHSTTLKKDGNETSEYFYIDHPSILYKKTINGKIVSLSDVNGYSHESSNGVVSMVNNIDNDSFIKNGKGIVYLNGDEKYDIDKDGKVYKNGLNIAPPEHLIKSVNKISKLYHNGKGEFSEPHYDLMSDISKIK